MWQYFFNIGNTGTLIDSSNRDNKWSKPKEGRASRSWEVNTWLRVASVKSTHHDYRMIMSYAAWGNISETQRMMAVILEQSKSWWVRSISNFNPSLSGEPRRVHSSCANITYSYSLHLKGVKTREWFLLGGMARHRAKFSMHLRLGKWKRAFNSPHSITLVETPTVLMLVSHATKLHSVSTLEMRE